MAEALARAPRGPILSAPAREAEPRRRTPSKLTALRLPRPRTASGYALLVFSAALIGIVVNAVVLQRDRHPAPFFAGDPSPPAAAPVQPVPSPAPPTKPVAVDPAPAPSPAATAAPAPAPVLPPEPPVRPVERANPPAAHAGDAIGDFLRTGGRKETSKTVLAAQDALIRLGYTLKATGAMNADTEAALRDFEKTHGLPVSSEVSAKLIAKLNAAAR